MVDTLVGRYQALYEAHGDSHLAVGWSSEREARIRYRVMSELLQPGRGVPALLDFGCGLSHFYGFLVERHEKVHYCGIDVVPEFVEASKRKYPQNVYLLAQDTVELPDVDYVVVNGVFAERSSASDAEMLAHSTSILSSLWPKTRVGLAFNVMSPLVGWRERDSFYLSYDVAAALAKKMSRRFVIRQDYGLREYTVYVYRN